MKIPQFLYVPRINTISNEKMVIETRIGAYFQILEFPNTTVREEWLIDCMEDLEAGKIGHSIHLHKKYPYLLFSIEVKSEVSSERLTKIGNMASDWYAQFYLKNKQQSKIDYHTFQSHQYFDHWLLADNILLDSNRLSLINLAIGVSISFDNADAYFATFEEFENEIADVQFLYDKRPEEHIVIQILTDAWNFLAMYEKEEELQAHHREQEEEDEYDD